MTHHPTHSLVYSAIGAGLIAVLSQILLPIGPVPFTLQTLAIGLIASLYPPKEAITSVLLYLLLGAIGLPVFAGFSGGFASLISPTAGFLWGFLLYAGLTSWLTYLRPSRLHIFLANLLGDSLCFILGSLVFKMTMTLSWEQTISLTVLPFLLPDFLKICLVSLCYPSLKKVLKQQS